MTTRVRPLKFAAEIEERFWAALADIVPPRVWPHLSIARREVLLALREMLDDAIARDGTPARTRRLRRVRVR